MLLLSVLGSLIAETSLTSSAEPNWGDLQPNPLYSTFIAAGLAFSLIGDVFMEFSNTMPQVCVRCSQHAQSRV